MWSSKPIQIAFAPTHATVSGTTVLEGDRRALLHRLTTRSNGDVWYRYTNPASRPASLHSAGAASAGIGHVADNCIVAFSTTASADVAIGAGRMFLDVANQPTALCTVAIHAFEKYSSAAIKSASAFTSAPQLYAKALFFPTSTIILLAHDPATISTVDIQQNGVFTYACREIR